jgi:type III secretory pathway component EscV
MMRFLEIAWLSIAGLTFVIAVYQIFTEGFPAATFMFIGTAISTGMFFLRRNQRRRFAKYSEEQKKSAQ